MENNYFSLAIRSRGPPSNSLPSYFSILVINWLALQLDTVQTWAAPVYFVRQNCRKWKRDQGQIQWATCPLYSVFKRQQFDSGFSSKTFAIQRVVHGDRHSVPRRLCRFHHYCWGRRCARRCDSFDWDKLLMCLNVEHVLGTKHTNPKWNDIISTRLSNEATHNCYVLFANECFFSFD